MEKALIPVSDRVAAIVADVDVSLGARALILRRRLKLTLNNISEATGIHPHRLSEMERGLREMDEKYIALLKRELKKRPL
jgi:transcriptional regulator with XRE-family HTH domain